MPFDARAQTALYDIRDNIFLARQFVTALTFDVFKLSSLHFYATTRALEIISEAVRRLPPEIHARHPDLPWRSIMDAGNPYRHAYDNVAEAEVWRTVQGSLVPLLEAVEHEIAILDAGEVGR